MTEKDVLTDGIYRLRAPEPEDLDELLRLVTDCKENIPNKTTPLREAITYADMVIQYVNDGSGTPDMISNALNRLRSTL